MACGTRGKGGDHPGGYRGRCITAPSLACERATSIEVVRLRSKDEMLQTAARVVRNKATAAKSHTGLDASGEMWDFE